MKVTKRIFKKLSLCWEVNKTQIKKFCQQFVKHNLNTEKEVMENLECELSNKRLINSWTGGPGDKNTSWKNIGNFLHEKVTGALIKARITAVKDMDAPTSFFFHLE